MLIRHKFILHWPQKILEVILLLSFKDDACGADEFLPALCYVLALCDLPYLLTDIHYTIELLPQEALIGEGKSLSLSVMLQQLAI